MRFALLWLMIVGVLSGTPLSLTAQYTYPYELQGSREAILLGGGLLTTGVSIIIDRKVPPLTDLEIKGLDVLTIPGIDRYAARQYSERAHQFSNVTALGSLAMPFALFLDKDNRQNFGSLSLIVFEGALITTGLNSLTKVTARRARPFVFNPDVPLAIKMEQKARYSFYSGHTAVSSFFAFTGAQLFNDLYPDSRFRPVVWTTAAVLPLLTGYGRMRAGKHFFTDVLVGYGVGALVGILIPRLHRI